MSNQFAPITNCSTRKILHTEGGARCLEEKKRGERKHERQERKKVTTQVRKTSQRGPKRHIDYAGYGLGVVPQPCFIYF